MYDQSARRGYLKERGHEPRLVPWRHDLAAESLKGQLPAARYEKGTLYQCRVQSTPLRFEPWDDSPLENQLIFGYMFTAYEVDTNTGLAWGQAEHDGHVGFVRVADFTKEIRIATHWVSAPIAYVLPRPDRKAEPVIPPLCLNSRVTVYEVSKEDGIYVRIGEDMWIFRGDLREIGDWFMDPVSAILPFADFSSYIWGHNDGVSFDCSGITQAGWRSMGLSCFRDADQQEQDAGLGQPIAFDPDLTGLRAHDQLYWPNHLALMVDGTRAIHAKGSEIRHVLVEPVVDINAWRLEEFGDVVRTIKRL